MSIQLRKMNAEEFAVFVTNGIKEYADDKVKAGTWLSEEALEKSKASFQELLPQQQETPNEHLLMIIDEEKATTIGSLWFHQEQTKAFIYDFLIFEAYRNQGYGAKTLTALESYVKPLAIKEIGLHVFAHNQAAVHLYEKMGFQATDISMSKTIK